MNTLGCLTKLKDNNEFRETAKNMKAPEELYEYLKKEGLTDSYDDFYKTSIDLQNQYSKLNESEISATVGGCGDSATTATTVTVTAGSIAVAFA